MKFFDAVKNALFEVEYVVDKPEEKKEEEKVQEEKKDEIDKPIAKKVILASRKDKKKETTVEEPKGDDLSNVNVDDVISDYNESTHKSFKVMNDNDFKMDDYTYPDTMDDYPSNKEEIKEEIKEEVKEEIREEKTFEERIPQSDIIYRQETHVSTLYGIDESNKTLVQEYGGRPYEKKEERSGFKPSPIISPIYGVLDKNYKKEDVKEKSNVRISSYSRENMNVDEIRNKAYGSAERKMRDPFIEELEEKKPIFEEEEDDDADLLVDLSSDTDKPSVKEITMGDALEYFNDLGLEYNVDYMDASKEKASGRRVKENYDEEPELFKIEEDIHEDIPVVHEEIKEEVKEVVEEPVVEVMEEVTDAKKEVEIDADDNLFDLIDSMYEDK